MSVITQKNILNIVPGMSAPLVVHVSQGDSGVELVFTLVDGDEIFDPTGTVISVHGIRQDGNGWGPVACARENGMIKFTLPDAATAVKGSGMAEVVISNESETVGTTNFAILVETATFPQGVTYANDVSVYEAILAYVQNMSEQTVANVEADLAAEIANRQAADAVLQGEITTNANNIITTNGRIDSLNEALASEVSAREAADTAEVTARNAAIASAVGSEASTRAAADDLLDARIDQIVAPSGEAPNPAEVTDARVGANGVTYSSLGNAIRGQIEPLNNAVKENNIVSFNDGFGYANIMDFTAFTPKYFYNTSGELTFYNDIIGGSKLIKIPENVKILEAYVPSQCAGRSVITYWAEDGSFISGEFLETSSGSFPRKILTLVPDTAKYFRIPFYNYGLKILVSSYALSGVVNGTMPGDAILSTIQHYTRNSGTGELYPSDVNAMSDLFSVDEPYVFYSEDSNIQVASLEYEDGDVVAIVGFASVVNLLPNKQYRIIATASFRTGQTYFALNEIKSLKLIAGSCNKTNGITSLASVIKAGMYYFKISESEDVVDLPADFPANTDYLLKVEEYKLLEHVYSVQTLYALSKPPFKYWRYTYKDYAWNDWAKEDTSVIRSKKISIYGDSISTYAGWNPTGNAVYYTGANAGVTSVGQTWWKKVIDTLGLNLLVNNSWSGRAVSSIRDDQSEHSTDAGYKEANVLQLKSGTTLPDIIIVKLGINDFNSGALLGDYDGSTALPNTPTKFLDAYAMMLNLIMTNFPLAEVYCCTLMQCERTGSHGFPEINVNGDSLSEWNAAIVKLAHAFGAKVLNHDVCGLTYYNMSEYMGDYESGSGLHPNAKGHSLIANYTIHEMDNAVRTRFN